VLARPAARRRGSASFLILATKWIYLLLYTEENKQIYKMKIIAGDLLDADADYIVQQCNCLSTKPHGLSETIAKKWPEADPYSVRRKLNGRNMAVISDRAVAGTILVLGKVICAFGQVAMGKPGRFDSVGRPDSAADRLNYFKACLGQIALLKPKSIAFPYKIGCGLAGGDWPTYEAVLQAWSTANPDIDVTLYKLE
jgi:O-acetyl-ADP-ribose deacetylase (regulator of RNase III)